MGDVNTVHSYVAMFEIMTITSFQAQGDTFHEARLSHFFLGVIYRQKYIILKCSSEVLLVQ